MRLSDPIEANTGVVLPDLHHSYLLPFQRPTRHFPDRSVSNTRTATSKWCVVGRLIPLRMQFTHQENPGPDLHGARFFGVRRGSSSLASPLTNPKGWRCGTEPGAQLRSVQWSNKKQQQADAVRAMWSNSPRRMHSANKEGDTESRDLYVCRV